jgi:hypothetical protein
VAFAGFQELHKNPDGTVALLTTQMSQDGLWAFEDDDHLQGVLEDVSEQSQEPWDAMAYIGLVKDQGLLVFGSLACGVE